MLQAERLRKENAVYIPRQWSLPFPKPAVWTVSPRPKPAEQSSGLLIGLSVCLSLSSLHIPLSVRKSSHKAAQAQLSDKANCPLSPQSLVHLEKPSRSPQSPPSGLPDAVLFLLVVRGERK